MKVECVTKKDALTIGKVYEVLGTISDYYEIIDDLDDKCLYYKSFFKVVLNNIKDMKAKCIYNGGGEQPLKIGKI